MPSRAAAYTVGQQTLALCVQEALVQSPAFRRQSEGVRARASAVLLGLLLRYAEGVVNLSPTDDAARFQAANAFGHAAVPRGARGTSLSRGLSLSPYPGASPGLSSGTLAPAEAAATARRDLPPTLLAALAALLEAHAAAHGGRAALTDDLPPAAHQAFVSFVNFACKAPPLLEDATIAGDPRRKGWGPPARAAYLRVLRAYACAPEAAYQIVSQLVLHAQHDDYEHISWQEYFKLMVALHDRYLHVTSETRFAAQDGAHTRVCVQPHTVCVCNVEHDTRRLGPAMARTGVAHRRSVIERTYTQHRLRADRTDPATEDERIMAVAYTDLAATALSALKSADSVDFQTKALTCLHDAMHAACPSHRSNSPPELLLQVRFHA